MTTTPEVPSLMDPKVQDDPFPAYAEMRRTCPVHKMPETGFHIITRYDDVRRIAQDAATYRNGIPPRQGLGGERDALYQSILEARGWRNVRTLNRCDGAEHARYRKLVERVFTPKTVRDLTPRIDAMTHEIIDRFIENGHCEFVHDFALQLPGMFIAEQLGLDRNDVMTLKTWGDAFVAMRSRVLSEDEVRATAEIELHCQHHLAKVFEARRANPGTDILSGLVHAHQAGEEPLSVAELQGMAAQLIAAGFETTMSAIGHGMWLLLEHPGEMAKLRADRDLMKTFVEEVLRFDAPVHGILRYTSADAGVAGVTIPKSTVVMPRYGAANRDESKFANPDLFDITRANASQHLSFGYGPHFCVGAALARQEMISAFTGLLDRLADIRLAAPVPTPAHEPSFFLRPMKELQISFRKAS